MRFLVNFVMAAATSPDGAVAVETAEGRMRMGTGGGKALGPGNAGRGRAGLRRIKSRDAG